MTAEVIKITKEQANILCYPEDGTEEDWNAVCAELGFDNEYLHEEEEVSHKGVRTQIYYFHQTETDKYFKIEYDWHECCDYDKPTEMVEVKRRKITKYVYEEIY